MKELGGAGGGWQDDLDFEGWFGGICWLILLLLLDCRNFRGV